MKALVTGATGFLGMCLARRLHQSGWDVTAVGRDKGRGALLTAAGIRFLPLDLCDKDAVARAGERQHVVFHCAGLSTVWGTYAGFYAGNVAATEHMIEAAQRHGAQRFVLVSTPSVYFDFSNGEPIRFVDAVNRLFAEMGETPRFRRVPYRTAIGMAAGMEAAYRLFKLNGEPSFTRYSVGVRKEEAMGIALRADIEYSAVFCDHLPLSTRLAWRSLANLLTRVGIPVMRKYKL
ncbi:NAD-dependent epimerase/dehydratase family protein [Paenibacillus dendritiformis]|uniref:NAD-dependent epimerase/dehydratase family protein n=1 Tax=Paenibacillus dendritiformis TaxID=130049 RepID=UPI001F54F978|nr:NAD(P)-dependent oxidoreductase [Paenibacillus dendritiformis]